jgi:hypothetical protein
MVMTWKRRFVLLALSALAALLLVATCRPRPQSLVLS